MDPELARQMFEEFAILVVLGMPPGTEFGIDLNSWNVGEKFRGVKMIPPGLHFVYFSAVSRQGDTAPRTGFFHNFERKELMVRHYDAALEDLKDEVPDAAEVERMRANIRDLDKHLGPYPLESWEKWVSLTQYITQEDLDRVTPLSGRICAVPELKGNTFTNDKVMEADPPAEPPSGVEKKESQEPNPELNGVVVAPSSSSSSGRTVNEPGSDPCFAQFPSRPYRLGATPSEITKSGIDSSFIMKTILDTVGRPEGLLAELQLAFICFLVGQVWDGWEQWRKFLSAICRAEDFLLEQHTIYVKFISVLHFQVQEVPADLFVDIVESNNFLVAALKVFFANVSDNSQSLPSPLVSKALKFRSHLDSKFGWNLILEDDGEDAPVIVETGEDAPVIVETGEDAPVIVETGEDAPVIVET